MTKQYDKQRYTFHFLLGMALFCLMMPAQAEDLFTLLGKTSSTSDDIEFDSVGFHYRSNRRDHFWPYKESATSALDWGVELDLYDGITSGTDFSGNRLAGILGYGFNDGSYISGMLGVHQLDVDVVGDNKQEEAVLGVSARVLLNNRVTGIAEIARDYVYQEGVLPGGAREFLVADQYTVGVDLRPAEKFRAAWRSSLWELSDSNQRQQHKFSLLYGISPGWPWIWAGLSYESLSYNDTDVDYWSPDEFWSAGIVFESSFPIAAKLNGSVSGSLTRLEEDNGDLGNGGSLFAGLDYELTEKYTLRLGYSRLDSQQGASEWDEDTFRLSINGSF